MFEKFEKSSLNKYPDPYEYQKVWQRVLWTLEVVSKELGIDRLSYSEISYFLTEIIELETSPQSVRSSVVNIKKGLVNNKDNRIKIMAPGRKLIIDEISPQSIYYIESGKTFHSKKILRDDILKLLTNHVKICDPYISIKTLDILSEMPLKTEIKILTINIQEKLPGSLKRALTDLINQGHNIEIRTYSGKDLHDRYIIDDNKMWIIGHSLKDLGKRECFILEVGPDLKQSVVSMFNSRWKHAQTI